MSVLKRSMICGGAAHREKTDRLMSVQTSNNFQLSLVERSAPPSCSSKEIVSLVVEETVEEDDDRNSENWV